MAHSELSASVNLSRVVMRTPNAMCRSKCMQIWGSFRLSLSKTHTGYKLPTQTPNAMWKFWTNCQNVSTHLSYWLTHILVTVQMAKRRPCRRDSRVINADPERWFLWGLTLRTRSEVLPCRSWHNKCPVWFASFSSHWHPVDWLCQILHI